MEVGVYVGVGGMVCVRLGLYVGVYVGVGVAVGEREAVG